MGIRYVILRRSCLFVLSLVAFGGLAGCGGNSNRPKTAEVKGVVTFEGKPLPSGSLLFVPTGGGPSAQGNIRDDGSYELGTFTDDDGAVLGSFKVMITAYSQPTGGVGLPEDAANGNAASIALIPEIYGDLENSGLTATVTESPNTINFDLVKQTPKKKARG
ncbi:hypothetical protein VT03_12075 [Planctomyces sp. SH-PL14]|nr:hypothetical protein VT03_12075 [Planctomyces sp. SH-PL14]